MYVLGISDGRFNSSVTLLKNNRILHSVNEERLTRKKQQGGFPIRSLNEAIQAANISYDDIDVVVFGGILTPNFFLRSFRFLEDASVCNYAKPALRTLLVDAVEQKSGITRLSPSSRIGKIKRFLIGKIIKKDLPRGLRKKPVVLVEHHLCHAAAAFYTSGLKKALCVTCDGMGDGVFFTVSIADNTGIKRIHSIGSEHSVGEYYTLITAFLGFKPHFHESKITGLAAFGEPENVKAVFPFTVTGSEMQSRSLFGISGMKEMRKTLGNYRREDVAAWVQKGTELVVTSLIKYWVRRTQLHNLVLAGGVFANVKLNQRIHELDGVQNVYVFPQMDDAGLALGAAMDSVKPKPAKLKNVYFGRGFTNEQIRKELVRSNLGFTKKKNVEKDVALLLSKGKVVARFNGRMEYGPRALGNRSILYQPTDPAVNDWLNQNLHRTEFMPFAPAVLAEFAGKCFKNVRGAEYTAKFMTITFNCSNWMKKCCPGVVHIDGTARPQLISKEDNPQFHGIIKEYHKLTGLPCIINTSFNMHEEPIVCTPEDAIRAFTQAKLDCLAIGDFLVNRKK